MAEQGSGWKRARAAIVAAAPAATVVPVVLRPTPAAPIEGRRVAFFGTSVQPEIPRHLRDTHGAEVVHVSGNLADREALREELPRIDAEVYVIELKAAAVDVVAEAAVERGVEIVLARNDVVPVEGGLDEALLELAAEAVAA
jgi:cyclic 2,3-diphosphoglycerate synthetase